MRESARKLLSAVDTSARFALQDDALRNGTLRTFGMLA